MIIPLPGDTYTVPVSTVDNYHAGGIAANVDIETGVLGAGTHGAPGEWLLIIIQRARKGPLGNERLGELLTFNLRRTLETRLRH